MVSIYQKFKWWRGEIGKEETHLTFILTKIFESYKKQFELFEKEGIDLTKYSEIRDLVAQFSVVNAFENNVEIFYKTYRKSIESNLFTMQVKRFETLERMRKTQFHIWKLFEDSDEYNRWVRNYNDRRNRPSRYVVARLGGFKEKPFVWDNHWYQGLESVKIIGLCGPSRSGKTTVCRSLRDYFGYNTIHFDNFFRKNAGGKCHGYDNWEIEESLMMDTFIEILIQLKKGGPVLVPSHGWTEDFDTLIYPKPIMVVEGFLLFNNETIKSMLDMKIFLDLSPEQILIRSGWEHRDYVLKCRIPHFMKIRKKMMENSDFYVDGNKDSIVVRNEMKKLFGDFISHL